jgi:hypothetical protein
MAPDALKGIRELYFGGDMEAAPALARTIGGPDRRGEVGAADHRGNRGAVFRDYRQIGRFGHGADVWVNGTATAARSLCRPTRVYPSWAS